VILMMAKVKAWALSHKEDAIAVLIFLVGPVIGIVLALSK